MLQKSGYVEMGSLPGEGCSTSAVRTRFGGRGKSQDRPECEEPELSLSQRVSAGLGGPCCKAVLGTRTGLGTKAGLGWRLVPAQDQHLLHTCICSCKSGWEVSLTFFLLKMVRQHCERSSVSGHRLNSRSAVTNVPCPSGTGNPAVVVRVRLPFPS